MFASLVLVGASIAACSSSTETPAPESGVDGKACQTDTECATAAAKGICDTTAKKCMALPPGHEIGYRDGTPASVEFAEIKATSAATKPVDLAFHRSPERAWELWVVGYGDNSTWVGKALDTDAPTWERFVDPAARHFMHKPTAISMSERNDWGTCGDNDNSQNDRSPSNFMGPALFSADLSIFAVRTPTGLGSHLDMLHSTPFCRGIAHETNRVYWAFNSYDQSIDRYDFAEDHGPGNDDHSDGIIHRYAVGQVKGVDGVVSHLVFDPSDDYLYFADTGNGRIGKLDTKSGTKGESLPRRNEPLVDQGFMDGTNVEVVVAPGVLDQPSGIEMRNDLIYVTDAATSTFHVFDKSGKEVRRLTTDLPPHSLAGFTFGPDGKIWFTDRVTGRILRIDPQ
ncbi:MAG: hypothetical protein KF819_15685 [Labilithrix sp.]|nr:hypothetical protein [Labilithrix sp.]